MSVQEMAEVVLSLDTADHEELIAWSAVESATFEAFVNDYVSAYASCNKNV